MGGKAITSKISQISSINSLSLLMTSSKARGYLSLINFYEILKYQLMVQMTIRSRLALFEQSLQNIENSTKEASGKIDQLTSQFSKVEEVLESLKSGMSAFTKSLSDLLRPFYNWTADRMAGNTISEPV
jgi:septal ring factor EnvC (AmiA/AmiB activator)